MGKLFGTDGIRGNATTLVTPDLVRSVGRAVAAACREGALGTAVPRPQIVTGRDTRTSGPSLETAFVDGVCSGGADALVGEVLPTAAVAHLTDRLGADAGIVISASHNPPDDNGIKVFGAGGWKLPVAAEERIEDLIAGAPAETIRGQILPVADALPRYIDYLCSIAPHDLAGLRLIVDCANGAASEAAPGALERLGAEVVAMNADADGSRINQGCGALHPDVVTKAALEQGAIGITFDGDADRVLLSDEQGRIVDGDAILALLAARLRDQGRLTNDAIVSTVMANQALRRWCSEQDIGFVETPVGDRHVLEALRSGGFVLGGEQSGHIVCLDRATTGDGILIAIEVLEIVATTGRPLSELVPFRPFPQVLVNVKTATRSVVPTEVDGVRKAVRAAEQRLGSDGRVLVRPSGTEPLVRVMVEAPDEGLAGDVAEDVADAVRRELNGAN
jgi:phosphoglucosamine mutase